MVGIAFYSQKDQHFCEYSLLLAKKIIIQQKFIFFRKKRDYTAK